MAPSSKTVQQVLNAQARDGWYALGGLWIDGRTPFSQAATAEFRPRLRGGKGGFGNMLKQEGERMSKKTENENSDACRNLEGQRVRVVNQAKAIAKRRTDAQQRKLNRDKQRKNKAEKALRPSVSVQVAAPKFVIGEKPKKQAAKTSKAAACDDFF